MFIEIVAPAVLPLGVARFETAAGHRTGLLGLTLQHPPVHLAVEASDTVNIVGPRADIGYEWANRYWNHYRLRPQANIEIELAIPANMGLGSETMLALSVARGLAWRHRLQSDTAALRTALGRSQVPALELRAFDQGGLLVVQLEDEAGNLPVVQHRREIAHEEREAWAMVLLLPRVPADTPNCLEANRLLNYRKHATYLDIKSGYLIQHELLSAIDQDDIAAFGQSLLSLQQLNQKAFKAIGQPLELTPHHHLIFELMRKNGAFAWGQSLTGMALYGLVKGAKATIELRKKLRHHVGIMGGIVMATITDNAGAREVIRDNNLTDNKLKPLRLR